MPTLALRLGPQPSSVASKCQVEGRTGSGMGAGASFFVGRSAAKPGAVESAPTATSIAFAPLLIACPQVQPPSRLEADAGAESLDSPTGAGKRGVVWQRGYSGSSC